jgi:thioredoxin reductase
MVVAQKGKILIISQDAMQNAEEYTVEKVASKSSVVNTWNNKKTTTTTTAATTKATTATIATISQARLWGVVGEKKEVLFFGVCGATEAGRTHAALNWFGGIWGS